MHWLGCTAINVRTECSSTLLRVSAILCCASAALVADGHGVSAAATLRNVGGREHARQLGTTLGRTSLTQREPPLVTPCRPGATSVWTQVGNFPVDCPPQGSHTLPGGITPQCSQRVRRDVSERGGGRSAGPGRSARPGSGLAGAASSFSHHATGSPRRQAAGLTATGSLGAVGGTARQCAVAATRAG